MRIIHETSLKKKSLKVLWRLMTKLERMGGDTEIDELDEQDEQYH